VRAGSCAVRWALDLVELGSYQVQAGGAASGLTSINGNQAVTFADIPQAGGAPGNATLSDHFLAEIFLAQGIGIKDAAGKDIVNVFGGLKYGWQVARS
jgi:hypothetical protein